jgi:LacI family transcriptional regulator
MAKADDNPTGNRRRVALLIETSLAPGREMLAGVARYAREHGPWSTFWAPRGLEESIPEWLPRWGGDGVIARVQSRQVAASILSLGLPSVDVLGVLSEGDLPLVHTDDRAIARAGAEHLLDRGFRHFAFFGWVGERWSERRAAGFAERVREAGHACAAFETTHEHHHRRPWEEYADEVAAWVRSLPKPVGLMLCTDQCGPVVLEGCRRAAAGVPDEVAVVGVDNDEALCETSDPPLTSVWPDHFGVGYRAAELLDKLMRGKRPPAKAAMLPPRGVVTRQSSDALAIDDRDVAAAVRVVRERACGGLGVDDVAAEVGVSRSVLQRRFRAAVGHTLHDEMTRVRLARARELLAHTTLPIAAVAEKAGFRHQEYLGVVFRRAFGTTPAQYRRAAAGQ